MILSMSACKRDSSAIHKEILDLSVPKIDTQKFLTDVSYKIAFEQKLSDYEDKSKELKYDLAKAYNDEGQPSQAVDVLLELIEHPLDSAAEETLKLMRKVDGSVITPAMQAYKDSLERIVISRQQSYYTELARSFQLSGDKKREEATRKKLTQLAQQDKSNKVQTADHAREMANSEKRDKEERLNNALSSKK